LKDNSEEKPSINQVKYILRNYGIQGVLSQISALIFGRARDYSFEEKKLLDEVIINIVKNEFRNDDLTIVTNINFGHTDPQIILPLGVKARLNNSTKEFCLIESPFQD
jgi:muramoyltetrapeptide carboxypeptidase LdcA involved in peptidoglycan recycling